MPEVFFSVIIPTYNRISVLKRAIESVQNQTFKNFELIVIDDGSNDGTAEYLHSLGVQFQTLGKPGIPVGVSKSRNWGVTKSIGEWLAFLDSDDEWLPHKLEKQYEFISKNLNLKIVHGEERWVRNGVRVNPKKKHQKSGGELFDVSLDLCLISTSTVVIKRELYNKFQGFREDFVVCEDYDLWLKITSNEKVGFIKEELTIKYGGHSDQLSTKYYGMDYYRIKSIDWVLTYQKLTADKKLYAIKVMSDKSRILLNGYEKHQNMTHFQEIESIQRKWL